MPALRVGVKSSLRWVFWMITLLLLLLSTAGALTPKQPEKGVVLGTSVDMISEVQSSKRKIEAEVDYWQKVVDKLTDYRDAYIHLSALFYQLNRLDEAKANLQKAIELDPNHPIVQKLRELFDQLPVKQ